MASNPQTVTKLLRNLRDNGKVVLQCGALTYIRSNAEKLEATSALNKEEYEEICRLVLETSIGGDQNARNEATKTLHSLLKHFRKHSIKFFDAALRVHRDKRFKIFQFLEATDDASLIAIIEDPAALNFAEDCLSSIKSDSMEWLLPTSCTENLATLEQAETRALTDAEEIEEIIVNNALVLLRRIYKTATTATDRRNVEKFDVLVMEKVVTLAYMGHKRQRGSAIRLLNQAIEADLPTRVKTKDTEAYMRYKKNVQGHYSTRMMLLVKACEPDWSSLWAISIRILGTDLHRGAPLINRLLSVEERAFKSTDTVVRREAFVSWKLLIDNLALDMRELATQRRVRLLCVPLTANNSKSELIALKKLEVWWYLIVKLYPNIVPSTDPVVTQFLNFCYGPLGDTPLLSTKFDVVASPGKRFYKAKILAIDALLQLLVRDQNERAFAAPLLDARLPGAVSDELFKQCYKAFLHCVAEAIVIISKLDPGELKHREDTCRVLWVNMMRYVRRTSPDIKRTAYTELILVITELQTRSLEVDFLNGILRDVIVPELAAVANDLIYYDNTLVDLMTKIMVPKFLKNLRPKQSDSLKCLMWQTVRPETPTNYHTGTLRFLETTLHQLRSVPVDPDSLTDCFDLWFAYAEIAHRYMKALQDVNEGSGTETNFKTIESIVNFPFTHMYWANSMQAQKIAVHWKDVYKKYECQADTIPGVKPNEVFNTTTEMIEASLAANEKCYRIAVHCLDALMATINYKFLLAQSRTPTIVRLVGDIAAIALHEGQPVEAECALKALSSLLITVYGHSPEKALSYMSFTSKTVELMLKTDTDDALIREIACTWETIVSILRGLSNLLDENFLQSYRRVISLALRHSNTEISAQALCVLEIKENVAERARAILAELGQEERERKLTKDTGTTTTGSRGKAGEKGDKTPKSGRLAGSFLNRKAAASPRTLQSRGGKDDAPTEARRVAPLPPDEPESQDYVVIRSEVRLDVDRLTEHQKESLKRRRDDIPAMYNDLSQSSSQDTQDLHKWFFAKKPAEEVVAVVAEGATAELPREEKSVSSSGDDKPSTEQKEGIPEAATTPSIVANSAQDPVDESILLGETPMEVAPKTSDANNQDAANEPSPDVARENAHGQDLNHDEPSVAKELNFESRDEYPDEPDKEQSDNGPGKTSRPRRSAKLTTDEKAAEADSAKSRGKSLEEEAKDAQQTEEIASTDKSKLGSARPKSGVKRKAPSPDVETENAEAAERDKKRKKSSRSPTEDNETISSLIAKRTEVEISRLRIDMVSDGPLTSRRRSKYNDDLINSETLGKRTQSPDRRNSRGKVTPSRSRGTSSSSSSSSSSRRTAKSAETDRDRAKRRRSRVVRTDEEEKAGVRMEHEDGRPSRAIRTRGRLRRSFQESGGGAASESQTIVDDDETMDDSPTSSRDSDNVTENIKSATPSIDAPMEEEAPENAQVETRIDLDEVVESSQDVSLLTGSHRRSLVKTTKLKAPEDNPEEQPAASSPINTTADPLTDDKEIPDLEKLASAQDPDETFLDISDIRPQLADEVPVDEETEKRAPEASKTSASPGTVKTPEGSFNFSSPKGQTKRYPKPRSFTSQGRAAHMLGLVTKLACLEKDGQVEKSQVDEEVAAIRRTSRLKENYTKDGDQEATTTIAKRNNVTREPERLGSPSGSRQEKIFNNMKSADFASPPAKLFGNLRNNGEKISPRMEKAQAACQDNGTVPSGKDDETASVSVTSEELPMLEWSSANPPSLTASPSASILKRANRIIPVNEVDLESSIKTGRKRVSFADPPVSKEMGYEIEASSPHKVSKFGTSRSLLNRRDSPIRMKQPRFLMIQMETEKPDRDETQPETFSCDVNCERDNELLVKIAEDLEDAMNFQNSENFETTETRDVPTESVLEEASLGDTSAVQDPEAVETSVAASVGIEEAPTQDDLFNSSDEKVDSPRQSSQPDRRISQVSQQQSSILESFKLNVTDDSVIGSVTDLPADDKNAQEDSLEDTIDVRNVTNLNFMTNLDFNEVPVRTSTQGADPISEMDTLPVTDSIQASLPITQDSQSSTQAEIPRPESLNSCDPVYPELDECDRPIGDVIDDLTNPLWRKNLSKYLETRCIRTVGDLARLSEREIVRIPVKGSSKIDFVRKVLRKFELKLRATENEERPMEIEKQREANVIPEANDQLTGTLGDNLDDISLDPTTKLIPVADFNDSSVDRLDPRDSHALGRTSTTNSMATIVIDSSSIDPDATVLLEDTTAGASRIIRTIELSSDATVTSTRSVGTDPPPVVPLDTKSTEAQTLRLDELLDEIDPELLLRSAVRRTSAEKLFAQYKLKMGDSSELDLCKETLRILGIDGDTLLRLACRECGLKKVLCELPNIFYNGHD